jgi:CRP/FNR family cyclic AMP-dependent transcriptional regulator
MTVPMPTGISALLRQVPLFSVLSEGELEVVSAAARLLRFQRDARIFDEGAPADCCYVVTAGRARVVLDSEEGTELMIGEVVPVEIVGEVALLDGCSRSASLVAAEACSCLRIPAATFEALRHNPKFERRVVSRLLSTLRGSTNHVRRMSFASSMNRVAGCLLLIARREGTRDGQHAIIPRKRHHELAAMAGCTRETVSRVLGELKRAKQVSWDGAAMRLHVPALQRRIGSAASSDTPAAVSIRS